MAFVNLVAWSVIFAYVYERSFESLPVTMLLHGADGAISQYVAPLHVFTELLTGHYCFSVLGQPC